jgi:pSer/pThr/pTyr-binding forkhead associated (FHA) protein
MAYIFDVEAKTFFPLSPHHTFGRLGAVDTCINKPYVSKLHAAIEWNSRNWCIKNLGLNGTWVNGITLEQGKNLELQLNDVLHFAKLSDAGFQVTNLTPPSDMLWPLEPTPEIPLDPTATKTNIQANIQPIYLTQYHLLPDANAPELAIYYDEQDQQWYLENVNPQPEQHRHVLQPGDKVQINNATWKFIRAQIYGPTEAHSYPLQKLNELEFIFNLSLDEETTQLELRLHQQTVDLAVRSHHYLLLQLARHRAQDAAKGLDSKSQGWIYTEQLGSELGLDTTHMNIHIFRLRKQLADSLPNTLGQQYLLERRGGKIRFGCEKFKIYKGTTLTTELPLAHINSAKIK